MKSHKMISMEMIAATHATYVTFSYRDAQPRIIGEHKLPVVRVWTENQQYAKEPAKRESLAKSSRFEHPQSC
jgi:hypothetical protein